tara:strand:+ start:158 stop:415 length:258 start_codon:yes stop_codon:yes gene_type:complete
MSVKRAIAKKLRPGGSGKITKKTRPSTAAGKKQQQKKKKYTKADMFNPNIVNKLSNAELMENLLRLKLMDLDFKKGGMVKKGRIK